MLIEGKKILITGGTGSLGQALTRRLLGLGAETIRIYSRNEIKQVEMSDNINDSRLRFFIGDVRDLPRLIIALEDVDIIFHTAALKNVPKIEYNPFEAVKTNIIGAQNVIDACMSSNVELAVAIGSDKSVSPLNTYGATKLLQEKLFVTAHNYLNPKKHRTKFIALRYGNVFGSSGSIIPRFIEQIKQQNKILVTNPTMTRFTITMDQALDFILQSIKLAKGSEIFVPKLRAYLLEDLKESLKELLHVNEEEIIGIREGEKMHEILINEDEMKYAWELEDKYIIFNGTPDESKLKNYSNIKPIQNLQKYSSDMVEKIPRDELKKLIQDLEFLK